MGDDYFISQNIKFQGHPFLLLRKAHLKQLLFGWILLLFVLISFSVSVIITTRALRKKRRVLQHSLA